MASAITSGMHNLSRLLSITSHTQQKHVEPSTHTPPAQSVTLSITPLSVADIPPEDAIIAAGKELLASTSTWKQGKTHFGVKTFSHTTKGDAGGPWHCRVSVHSKEEATFGQIWGKLGKDKATNEKEFIPEIKKVTLIKSISPTQSIWSLYYSFPPPVAARVFTVLQVLHLDESSPRTGIVVSIPIDLSAPGGGDLSALEEKGVRGRYVSVERVIELEDGRIEWRMATSSTPGGNIPQFIVERTMPAKIAEDVPHFLKWLHTLPASRALTPAPE